MVICGLVSAWKWLLGPERRTTKDAEEVPEQSQLVVICVASGFSAHSKMWVRINRPGEKTGSCIGNELGCCRGLNCVPYPQFIL